MMQHYLPLMRAFYWGFLCGVMAMVFAVKVQAQESITNPVYAAPDGRKGTFKCIPNGSCDLMSFSLGGGLPADMPNNPFRAGETQNGWPLEYIACDCCKGGLVCCAMICTRPVPLPFSPQYRFDWLRPTARAAATYRRPLARWGECA